MRMLANLVTLLICFGIRIAIGLRAIVKRQGRAEAEGQRQILCHLKPRFFSIPRKGPLYRGFLCLFFVGNIVS